MHMIRNLLYGLTAAGALLAGAAMAQPTSLKILQPTTRATPLPGMTAVGYLQIENDGRSDDRLLGAHSTAADSVEIHQMRTTGGMMQMRPLKEGLAVPAGARVDLRADAASGYHLMVIGVKQQLNPGDRLPLVLDFEKAGAVPVDFVVQPLADTASGKPAP